MRVVYRPEAARRSPCYTCEQCGRGDYPDCAGGCEALAAYRRLSGLPQTSPAEVLAALHKGRRRRSEQKVEGLRQFLVTEKKRLKATYPEMADLLGIGMKALYSFMIGLTIKMGASNLAKIAAYKTEREQDGAAE